MTLVSFMQENWFALSCIGSLVGCTWKVSNLLNKHNSEFDLKINSVKTTLNDRIDILSEKVEEQELKRDDGVERTRLIMEGVEATLYTLHNQGANGPVTASLHAFSEYKNKKAAQ